MHPLNRHDFPTPRSRCVSGLRVGAPSFELLLGLRVLTALPRPQCYRGVCGGWRTLPAVILNEAQREDWIASDDTLANCDPSLPYVGCPPGGCGDSCCSDLNAHAEDASELITSYICHCANCHCPVCIPEVSVDDYIRFLSEFAPALRKYGLRLEVCVGEIGPASISQTDEMLRYMDAMAPDGKLAVMAPVYFGGQTAKSKRWLRPLLNRSTQLNPMFGIEYRQPPGFNLSWCETQHHGPGPIGRRVPPPCNRYNYNRTEFAGLLDWLRENGACEVSLYGLQMPNATEFIEDCKACAHCRRFECCLPELQRLANRDGGGATALSRKQLQAFFERLDTRR